MHAAGCSKKENIKDQREFFFLEILSHCLICFQLYNCHKKMEKLLKEGNEAMCTMYHDYWCLLCQILL